MSWDMVRAEYQQQIKEIQKSIDYNLEQWAKTGDENHKKFADDNVKKLKEIKEYIVFKEQQAGLY